jgi:hypothetical protein
VIWVSCSSHRARKALQQIVPDLGASFGVWPLHKDGTAAGWPRGEYFQVSPEHRAAIERVKGLRVMASAPRGDIFRRWESA